MINDFNEHDVQACLLHLWHDMANAVQTLKMKMRVPGISCHFPDTENILTEHQEKAGKWI